jgi:hypothetical protein
MTNLPSLLRRHLLIVETLYNLVIQITDVQSYWVVVQGEGSGKEMPAEEATICPLVCSGFRTIFYNLYIFQQKYF